MTIQERKERQKEERRQLILKAAMELFLKEGFEKVTMRHIARAIDYSPAALYLSFNNKDEILFALHTEGFRELYRREQAVAHIRDPLERLRKLGEAYVRFALENPAYYDLMFIMRGPAKLMAAQKRWDSGRQAYEALRSNVQECMEKGAIPRADLDAATFGLWAFVHGIASLIIRSRTMMVPAESLNGMVSGALGFLGILMRAARPAQSTRQTKGRRRR